MGIKHITYKSISRERRRQQATRAMIKMREMLQLNPGATEDQRKAVEDKIKHLQKWVDGNIEPPPTPTLGDRPIETLKAKSKPKHVEVVVEEELGIDESVEKPKKDKDEDE